MGSTGRRAGRPVPPLGARLRRSVGGHLLHMRTAVAWLVGWLVLFLLWLLFLGEASIVDVAAGAAAAAIAATTAAVVRAQGLIVFRIERAWALRSLRVPARLLSELALVAFALVRGRPHGRMRMARFSPQGPVTTHPFPAWAETITPNDYVLEIDDGVAVKHVLVDTPAAGEVL